MATLPHNKKDYWIIVDAVGPPNSLQTPKTTGIRARVYVDSNKLITCRKKAEAVEQLSQPPRTSRRSNGAARVGPAKLSAILARPFATKDKHVRTNSPESSKRKRKRTHGSRLDHICNIMIWVIMITFGIFLHILVVKTGQNTKTTG